MTQFSSNQQQNIPQPVNGGSGHSHTQQNGYCPIDVSIDGPWSELWVGFNLT